MSNFTIRSNKATANSFLVGKMRTSAIALCAKYNGTSEIADTKNGKRYRFTFTDKTCAAKFVHDFDKAYADATSTKTPAPAPEKKPASKKAPKNGKGNAVNFSKFKGTTSEKNKALHKHLVGMGITDSRTPEYTSVWNARPWAK